ncbi:hypothetical protein [Halorubrum sp. AS12]|uniref:hypothetical protein n=1 Tax=Halorubrum sp. AS12 TaxID=3409687 RepID=UPI003DA77792
MPLSSTGAPPSDRAGGREREPRVVPDGPTGTVEGRSVAFPDRNLYPGRVAQSEMRRYTTAAERAGVPAAVAPIIVGV